MFHDDQHGTAIIIAAGLLNALELQGKTLEDARVVVLGAGAAGIASVRLLISMGARRNNIVVLDRVGVIHTGRKGPNPYKFMVAAETESRTLEDVIEDADVIIGVSGPELMTKSMLASMAPRLVVFALSNPVPEIRPEVASAVRNVLIMATGRSDYPNQVNNVLGFPFIFHGALDVSATRINEDMQIAAVHALKDLTHKAVPESVLSAYGLESLTFGSNYILPEPFGDRLKDCISAAVARAAMISGVARGDWPAHYPVY